MDKLQPQTVYVPVPVPMKQWIKTSGVKGAMPVRELPGVYPLTGKELWDFFQEYIHSDLPPHEFLKQKGIEI